MEFGIFSTRIKDRLVELQTAADVARFSFMVQNSVSYLDLTLCKTSMISDYFSSFCDSCRSRPLTNFVNTEEKCRQFFAPRRRLLYILHLDLPKERECKLNDIETSDSEDDWQCCKSIPNPEIAPAYGFYDDILSNFIDEAFSVNTPKARILKWILKLSYGDIPLLSCLDIRTASKFIDCFYPEVTDFALLSDFIKQFDIIEWMEEYEQPKILEFLLYHARIFGNIYLDDELAEDCISVCIYYKHYLNVGPILKYISGFKPANSSYNDYLFKLSSVRPQMAQNVIYLAITAKVSKERLCLLMQVILAYTDSQGGLHEAASEALRLIWNSIPDACVTYGELKDVSGASLSEKELRAVFVFYAKAIGEFPERVRPHPLQHLCRIILRKTFEENNLWIPDAISRTGLPKMLQSFLNLEKQFGY